LAKDSSASLAWLISHGANRDLDLLTLFLPSPHLRTEGLFQLEPFDPNRIPIVFIHGLMSRPETWRNAINELQADPVIRKNYQFWLFSYPTGWPVWVSSARLREELDRFNTALSPMAATPSQRRKLNQKILVGHSMGGLIANLQIRQGGDLLWQQFSRTPLNKLRVPPATREALLDAIDFRPREDISRIIFAAVPHRGSPTALTLPARWAAANIRFLVRDIQNARDILLGDMESEFQEEFVRPLNSIRFLRANSPLLRSILELPRREDVPLHSIIGDRGIGNGEKSSDGIVPFWSSHLAEATSEKFVPSGHGAHVHPEGIAEIARILREAAPDQSARLSAK
jgi:pimeloyl-ACP methyl ester carboxylesterase